MSKRRKITKKTPVVKVFDKWQTLGKDPWVYIFSFCEVREHLNLNQVASGFRAYGKLNTAWSPTLTIDYNSKWMRPLFAAGRTKVQTLHLTIPYSSNPVISMALPYPVYQAMEQWKSELREFRLTRPDDKLPIDSSSPPISELFRDCPKLEVLVLTGSCVWTGDLKELSNLRVLRAACYSSTAVSSILRHGSKLGDSLEQLEMFIKNSGYETIQTPPHAVPLQHLTKLYVKNLSCDCLSVTLCAKTLPSLKSLYLKKSYGNNNTMKLDEALLQQLIDLDMAEWSWQENSGVKFDVGCGLSQGSKSIQTLRLDAGNNRCMPEPDDLVQFIDKFPALKLLFLDISRQERDHIILNKLYHMDQILVVRNVPHYWRDKKTEPRQVWKLKRAQHRSKPLSKLCVVILTPKVVR